MPITNKKASLKSALVVDDEPSIVKLLFEILRKHLGYDTDTASCGEEAINKLSRRDYDVTFLDIRMPILSGKDLFKRLHDINEHLPNRVIFCTADTLNPETQKFLDTNRNLCLVKPFGLRDVKSILDEIIERKNQA